MEPGQRAGTVDRRGAWLLLAASGITLLVLAAGLVPWDWASGLTLRRPAADEVFDSEQLRAAESHARALRTLTWSSYALGIVLALVLGLTRAGAAVLRTATGTLPWWLAVPWGALVLLAATRLVVLPFGLLVRQRNLRDGLTDQGLADWFVDWALSLLVSWVLVSMLLLLVVGLARRTPRWWFAWCGGALVALTFAASFVYPVVVEPLFNDFRPLPDGPFRDSVLALAEEEGVRVGEVLVSDASRRTTTLNAYVSGFGGTRRIVLYDNLVAGVPPDQALSVVAHELAHARHRDVLLGTGLGALGVLVGVSVLALLLDSPRLAARAGVGGPADPRAVALLLAMSTLGGALSGPAQNAVSRAIEGRADLTALRATEDTDAFAAVQVRLAERALSDPTPPRLGYLWFASHPTVLERLALADAVARTGAGGTGR